MQLTSGTALTSTRSLIEFLSTRQNPRWISSQYLRFFMLRLDGRTRFNLKTTGPRATYGRPNNMLVHLFMGMHREQSFAASCATLSGFTFLTIIAG